MVKFCTAVLTIPRETEGRWVYHAFHVPECPHFERRDAHLVERWGVYEGSYTIVETIPLEAIHSAHADLDWK